MTQQLMDLQEQFDDLGSVSEQEYFINLNLVHASDTALHSGLILTRDPGASSQRNGRSGLRLEGNDRMEWEMSHHMEI